MDNLVREFLNKVDKALVKVHDETGSPETTYVDITEHVDGTVTTNKDGWGEFRCKAGSVSAWVPK